MVKRYSVLRGIITERNMMHAEVADAIGLSKVAFSYRMTGKIPWDVNEIRAICKVLNIPSYEIVRAFELAETTY